MPHIDKLTGLQTLSWVREQWGEFESSLPKINTLLYFDIDTLICFTDIYGMQESDDKLVFVADTIREFIPDKYPVIRFAGEEFLSLVNDKDFSIEDLKKLIKKMDLVDVKIIKIVSYSNIDHFSVSACMMKNVKPVSFQEFGELTDRAVQAIEKEKSHIENRKYQYQGVVAVEE